MPANFVFSSQTVIKVVEHETTKVIIKISGGHEHCPDGQFFNRTTSKCQDNARSTLPCERADSSAITDLDKNLKTKDCDIHDANEHGITPPPPPPPCNSPNYNGTCLPTNNMIVAASVGKGTTCAAGNCTTGTPPPVDCKINPNDPSCTQTLQPLTPPTTKTCPDGSVIDTSASCPTQSTPPPPTNNNLPPTENNPPPSSGNDNGNTKWRKWQQ